jgi:hypothetical protein
VWTCKKKFKKKLSIHQGEPKDPCISFEWELKLVTLSGFFKKKKKKTKKRERERENTLYEKVKKKNVAL